MSKDLLLTGYSSHEGCIWRENIVCLAGSFGKLESTPMGKWQGGSNFLEGTISVQEKGDTHLNAKLPSPPFLLLQLEDKSSTLVF